MTGLKYNGFESNMNSHSNLNQPCNTSLENYDMATSILIAWCKIQIYIIHSERLPFKLKISAALSKLNFDQNFNILFLMDKLDWDVEPN